MSELQALHKAVESMEEKLDTLTAAVLGDPRDETNPGMLIRIDRLERTIELMKKVIVAIIGSVITVGGAVAAALLMRML